MTHGSFEEWTVLPVGLQALCVVEVDNVAKPGGTAESDFSEAGTPRELDTAWVEHLRSCFPISFPFFPNFSIPLPFSFHDFWNGRFNRYTMGPPLCHSWVSAG